MNPDLVIILRAYNVVMKAYVISILFMILSVCLDIFLPISQVCLIIAFTKTFIEKINNFTVGLPL